MRTRGRTRVFVLLHNPYRSGKAIWTKIGSSIFFYLDEDNLCVFKSTISLKIPLKLICEGYFKGLF